MKKYIISGILSLVLSTSVLAADYSNGWRMGQLTKFSLKGLISKSGEGQMLVGSESTPYVITSTDSDGNTTRKTINPWYFSSNEKTMQQSLMNNIGEYVVIKYKQAHIRNFLASDTDYSVTGVLPIADPLSKTCKAKTWSKGSKSKGVRVGRIVKASTKGTFVNSFEVMVQQGNSGNQFKNMSISEDKALFDCAVQYLKAGQKVKIHYDQSHFNLSFARNSTYDIVKIEPVKGLN